jgi:hypothetical protein
MFFLIETAVLVQIAPDYYYLQDQSYVFRIK